MTETDWDEIKRLAADFQKAQLSSTSQRLSERNCIEIVTKLIELKLIDVIFTTDGKEYLTQQQLIKEIKDEIYIQGGRVNTVDLAKELSVDLNQINNVLNDIVKGKDVQLVSGHLLTKLYLEKIAREINVKLQQQGQLKIGDLTLSYDLPADFLQHNVLEKYLGKVINGKQDPYDSRIFYTEEYIKRSKSKIRGAVLGLTRPTPIAVIVNHCNLPERLFTSLFDELQAPGSLTGRQAGALYIPHCYSKSQIDWVTSFYKQNNYLEYDALLRLGISDYKGFIKRNLPQEDLYYLTTCAVGSLTRDRLTTALDECISSMSFMDVISIIPSVLNEKDIEGLLDLVLKDNAKSTILFDYTILSTPYLEKLSEKCLPMIDSNVKKVIDNGSYLQYIMDKQISAKVHDYTTQHVDVKAERREERRRKAASGKVGGGTQGRETKTKAVKKHPRGGAKNTVDSDSDDNTYNKVKKAQASFEIVKLSDIEEVLSETLESEGIEHLSEQIANYLYGNLNQIALCKAKEANDKLMQNATQNRKQTHSSIQDKINTIVNDIRLYEKGIKQLPQECQGQYVKYLLKSLGSDIVAEICKYAATQCNLQVSDDNLTTEQRNKIVNDLSDEYKKSIQVLIGCLNEQNVDVFLQALDSCLDVCGMILKKVDKKKDRIIIHSHKEKLVQELISSTDPPLTLHLSVLILFTTATQCMVHASGKHLHSLLLFLKPYFKENLDSYKDIMDFYDSVSKYLSSNDEEKCNIKDLLSEKQSAIKKLVQNFKK